MLRRPHSPSAASDAQVERARQKRQREINRALGCTELAVEPAEPLEDPDREPTLSNRPASRATSPRSYVLSEEGRRSIALSNKKRRGRAPKPRRDRTAVDAILALLRSKS